MSTTGLGEASRNFTLRQTAERKAGKPIPKDVIWELTYKCNLRCLHCGLESYLNQERPSELTFPEITKILDQIFETGVLGVSFTGGEPLCRPDILDIMEYTNKAGLFFGLKTNGTLLTEKMAKAFRMVGIVAIHVSLYGATPEVHEHITGVPGSFEKSINAIKMLKSNNIRVKIKTSIMKCNFDDDMGLSALAGQLGVRHDADPLIYPKFDQPGSADKLRIDDEQLRQLITQKNWINLDATNFPDDPEARLLCGGARARCSISPRGEVFPCPLWQVRLGDLRRESFKDVWYGEAASRLRAITINDFPDCIKCDLLRYCFRCPGMVQKENGGISGPSPEHCRLARAIKGVIDDEETLREPHHRVGTD